MLFVAGAAVPAAADAFAAAAAAAAVVVVVVVFFVVVVVVAVVIVVAIVVAVVVAAAAAAAAAAVPDNKALWVPRPLSEFEVELHSVLPWHALLVSMPDYIVSIRRCSRFNVCGAASSHAVLAGS